MHKQSILTITCLTLALLIGGTAMAADKMPAELAGDVGSPTDKIAFIRNKNIWTMDAHGGHQMKIVEAGNADGRMTWSPDGTKILFTRSGTVDLRSPEMLGGKHKVYDLFFGFIDKALKDSTFYWQRITEGLGSRDPEWSADGKTIVFYKDVNANMVDAVLPNYQIATMDADGSNVTLLRKDWQNMSEFFISPSMSPSGEIAFVHFEASQSAPGQPSGFKSIGIAKLPRGDFMAPLASVRKQSLSMAGMVAPSWSPDGKWLAYVSNKMTAPGIYISPADLSASYLVFAPPPGTSLYTMAPSFSPNSKWLTFATTDGSIWICDITGNGAKRLSGPGTDWAPAWSKAAK